MSDDDERTLRERLHAAVPPAPSAPDRVAGALRRSQRTRRTRGVVTVGAAALAVVLIATVPSVVAAPDHTAGPSTRHAPTLSMPPGLAQPFTCSGAAAGGDARGAIPAGAVAVRLCASSTPYARWTSPREPLVTDVGTLIDEINALPATQPRPCPSPSPGQPAFDLRFGYPGGRVFSVNGQVGGCDLVTIGSHLYVGARQVLLSYVGGLHEQRARYAPPVGLASEPVRCLSDRGPEARSLIVDRRDLRLTSGRACSYVDPGPQYPVAAGPLSTAQLRMISADIAAHATRHPIGGPAVRSCKLSRGPVGVTLITAVDVWGDRIDLVGSCVGYSFIDRDGFWYWTPTAKTEHMLEAVQHPVAHSTGRLTGRLVAVGGVAAGAPRPLAGTVTLQGAGLTQTVRIGSDGTFSTALQPGRYRVVGHSSAYQDGHAACVTMRPYVTVRAHQTVHVSVLCEEK